MELETVAVWIIAIAWLSVMIVGAYDCQDGVSVSKYMTCR